MSFSRIPKRSLPFNRTINFLSWSHVNNYYSNYFYRRV